MVIKSSKNRVKIDFKDTIIVSTNSKNPILSIDVNEVKEDTGVDVVIDNLWLWGNRASWINKAKIIWRVILAK